MTLSDMEADLYRRLGYDATPAASVTTRLRAFINETYREILAQPGMERFRDDTITVASTADQQYLALPQSVARVKMIHETTNDRIIEQISLRQLRRMNPEATTGTPQFFAVLGTRGVAVQPSDASAIFVDSDNAGDTGTAYIQGVRTGGYREVNSETMTGTTGVQIGSLSDWIQIDKFYLSAAATGTVTLHEDSEGGTELARISIGGTYARYLHILLEPVPSAAVTYTVDYVREIEELANATDEPVIPPDFHRLLAVGARMKEYERREDGGRYASAQTEFLLGLRSIRFWLHTVGGNATRDFAPQHSQLGPTYPAGS